MLNFFIQQSDILTFAKKITFFKWWESHFEAKKQKMCLLTLHSDNVVVTAHIIPFPPCLQGCL